MKRGVVGAVALMLLAGCATTRLGLQDTMVIRAKDKVAPALVHIVPVKEVYSAGRREEIAVQGSGFILSSNGYVVTNEHVAGQSRFVKCVLQSKEEFDAEVVGVDPYTDVAVLKLNSNRQDFPVVRLGSSEGLQAGQTVLALGSPHGLSRSVSSGIVSVTDRYLGPGERYLSEQDANSAPFNNWIQTDAAINHGNSGGPLVNLRGEVVGINTRKLGGADNVGFAIPIDMAREVAERLIADGKVHRSTVGISIQETLSKTDDPTVKGVVVADVEPYSPAAEAGIRPGDLLQSINGRPVNARFVESLPAVRKAIADLPVDSEAVLRVVRGDEILDIKVKTVEKGRLEGEEVEFAEWGFTAAEVTPLVARQAQLPSPQGVRVSGTQVGSVAANAKLMAGDIILKVDEHDIADLEGFRTAFREAVDSGKKLVLLDVKRGALTRYVLVKQDNIGTETAEPTGEPVPALPEGADGHAE